MVSIFWQHTTRYLADLHIIYLHLETFEDRNPEIFFMIKFACASPTWNHFYDHSHTRRRHTGVFETVNPSKPVVLSPLRGSPLCIEIPFTVLLFNRSHYLHPYAIACSGWPNKSILYIFYGMHLNSCTFLLHDFEQCWINSNCFLVSCCFNHEYWYQQDRWCW